MTRRALPPREGFWSRYLRDSESAFAALIFLLPWVIAYEIGTWYVTFDPISHTEQRIVAFGMLQDSLASIGATARWVAPAAVISVLLSLTITRKEPLQTRATTQSLMIVESALLAAPVLLLSFVLSKINLLAGPEPFSEGIVLSIGAGIYEEFVFRLIGIAAVHFFLVDFLGIRPTIGTTWAVTASGAVFSLYHYWGSEAFATQTFVFRAIAGCYFGWIMLSRGFAVTVGCHIIYDVAVCGLREWPVHPS